MKVCRVVLAVLFFSSAWCLPFNDDMVDIQLRTGASSRARPQDSIPQGYANFDRPIKGAADGFVNPNPVTAESIARGKRLFAAQCYVCHGDIAAQVVKPMPAGMRLGAPPIGEAFYATRTEGSIFSTIVNGNIIMPALGYKFSNNEVWDLVNYVKDVQKKKSAK